MSNANLSFQEEIWKMLKNYKEATKSLNKIEQKFGMHQPISSYLILNKLEHFLLIWNCTIVKMFFRLVTSVGQRKILSPHEESNLRPSALRSTTEPQRLFGERGLLRSSNDTRAAYRWEQLVLFSSQFSLESDAASSHH